MSRCAIGAAISEIRQAETGRGLLAEYHRVLSSHTPDELANLRKVVAVMQDDGPTLEQQICTILIGIAVRRGEPWKPIVDLCNPATASQEFDAVHRLDQPARGYQSDSAISPRCNVWVSQLLSSSTIAPKSPMISVTLASGCRFPPGFRRSH